MTCIICIFFFKNIGKKFFSGSLEFHNVSINNFQLILVVIQNEILLLLINEFIYQ